MGQYEKHGTDASRIKRVLAEGLLVFEKVPVGSHHSVRELLVQNKSHRVGRMVGEDEG